MDGRKGPRRSRDFVIGGPVIGSVVGDGNSNTKITVHSIGQVGSASVEDLREELALLLSQVEAASGSGATDDRVRYEVQTIKEELEEGEPDAAVVRSRWKQVQKLLGPLQHIAGIAQSTERILTLVRTLFGGS